MRRITLALVLLLGGIVQATAQNPVSFLNQPVVPSAVAPGGPDFTLTVNGTWFVSGATINWNGSPLATTFVSFKQLTATVPAAKTTFGGTATITVVTPAPGGGTSNFVFFQISGPSAIPMALGTPRGYPTTPQARFAIVAADFNADGKTDLASDCGVYANVSIPPGSVCVMSGNGDGTFGPAQAYPIASVGRGIVVGDFNGDGRLDLAGTGDAAGEVSVLLGNGDGTFQPHLDSPAGPIPEGIVAGDFNGDGKLDLAVVNTQGMNVPGLVSVLFGNGDGTFQSPISYGVANNPYPMSTVDLNGDGVLDLIVGCQNSGSVSVLLGNGDGTFQDRVDYVPTGDIRNLLWSVVVADFNHDGIPDIAATVGNYSYSGGYQVYVLLGRGDGTFEPGIAYPTGSPGTALTTGDFNADGNLDVALLNSLNDSGSISVLIGNGDGTFQPRADYRTAHTPSGLVAGDFNSDGLLDFALTNDSGINQLYVQFQNIPVQLAPLTASFGNQSVGTTATLKTLTLANNGTTPVTISNISLSGTDSGEFPHAFHCPLSPDTLGPGENCRLNITFSPTATGTASAVLKVTETEPSGSQVAGIAGTGINPRAAVSPASLSFDDQELATTSAPQTVTLTNSGIGPLSIANIVASANFAQTNDCGPNLAEGASCTVNVTFAPTAGGSLSGSITITDNVADSPQTVSLSGTGLLFIIVASSASATISPGETAAYKLNVTSAKGFNQPIAFGCIGGPRFSECIVSPNRVVPSGAGPAAITVSVKTYGASLAAPRGPVAPSGPGARRVVPLLLLFLALAAVAAMDSRLRGNDGTRKQVPNFFSLVPGRGSPSADGPGGRVASLLSRVPILPRLPISYFLLPLCLLVMLLWPGCGGGGDNPIRNPGTPAGSYLLTITATTASGSGTVTQTITLNLKVT